MQASENHTSPLDDGRGDVQVSDVPIEPRRHRFVRRQLKRLIGFVWSNLVNTAAVIVCAILGFLQIDSLSEERAALAAAILSDLIGREVRIARGANLDLSEAIEFVARGVSLADQEGFEAPEGELRLTASWSSILATGDASVSIALSDLVVVAEGASGAEASRALGARVAGLIVRALSFKAVEAIDLERVVISRVGSVGGWNDRLEIDQLVLRKTQEVGRLSLNATGSINGRPLSLDGFAPSALRVTALDEEENFDLEITSAGVEARITGLLYSSPEGPQFDGRIAISAERLSSVAAMLGLDRRVEGEGSLTARLNGPVEKLAASEISLALAAGADGAYEFTGSVNDVWTASGLDIASVATLARPVGASSQPRFDPRPRKVSARLKGDATRLQIEDLVIESGLAALELQRIGPISIDALERTADGRIRLTGIRLLQGPSNDPVLDFTGEIGDALRLRDWRADGAFRLDLAGFLSAGRQSGGLGDLRGEMALSDLSGSTHVDRLRATVIGTDVLQMEVSQRSSDLVDLSILIHDSARLGALLGRQGTPTARVAFDGHASLGGLGAAVDGTVSLDDTVIEVDLNLGADDVGPFLRGALGSQSVSLEALSKSKLLSDAMDSSNVAGVRVNNGARNAARIELDLVVGQIASVGTEVRDVRVDLSYQQGVISANEIAVSAFGGRAHGEARLMVAESGTQVVFSGTGRALRLESVFALLGRDALATGPIDAHADGSFFLGEALETLNGNVRAALRDGRMTSRAVDLAGQSIVAWSLTPTPDGGAPLLCALAAVSIRDGRGQFSKLALESSKVVMSGQGTVDANDGTVDVLLTPTPKRPDLVGRIGTVHVRGRVTNPSIDLDEATLSAKLLSEPLDLATGALRGLSAPLRPREDPAPTLNCTLDALNG